MLRFVAPILLVAACTSDPEPAGPTPSAAPGVEPLTVRVMEFNVEYGGTGVDFDSIPKVVEASGADIVAIEEGYGNMPAIAGSVGWYFDNRSQVMSRFPLLRPPGDQPFVYVEVTPGSVVAVANVHLPSVAYGPFKIRDGASAEEVLDVEERKRVAALDPTLAVVEGLAADGVPVFLIGDFNAPSHLDWTDAAVGIRDHVLFPLAWPASVAVEEAGLADSYREANPDPVADPGLTWPADRPFIQGYNPYQAGAAADRIDFVYAGGPAETIDSELVGEEGGEGVDIAVTPWPTDHRATVSTFEVEPTPAPTIVSVDQRLVTVGEELVVRYHATSDAVAIAVVPAGADAADATVEYLAGEEEVTVPTATLRPGAYEVVLRSEPGAELARAPFWVQAVGGEPEIGTVRPDVRGRRAHRGRVAPHAGQPLGLGRHLPARRRSEPSLVPDVGPNGRHRGGIRGVRHRCGRRLAAGAGRLHRLPAPRRQLRGARERRLPRRVTADHSRRSSISHVWSSTCHAERRTK